VLAALSLLSLGLVSIGHADISGTVELDGNELYNGSPGAVDWANSGPCSTAANGTVTCAGTGGLFNGGVFKGNTTPPTPPSFIGPSNLNIVASTFGADPLSVDNTACGGGDPTVYTGVGGEKNGDLLNSETYGTGSVPDKDDLSNVAAIARKIGTPGTAGAVYEIFFMSERNFTTGNGDSHLDFEFLQAHLTAPTPCAGSFAGHRTQGDIILAVDFTKGGTLGDKHIYRWICDSTFNAAHNGNVCDPGKASQGLSPTAHYEEIVLAPGSNILQFGVNSGGPISAGGWASRKSDGTPRQTIDTNDFMEGGIDLNALGFTGCISSFLPHTRSSQSFTATLKDFQLLEFNTCAPTTLTTVLSGSGQGPAPSITVPVGTLVTEQGVLTSTIGTPGGSITYKVFTNSNCSTLYSAAGVTNPQTKSLVGGIVPASDPIPFNSAGTFYFTADYSGDGQNLASSSACQEEVLTVLSTSTTLNKSLTYTVAVNYTYKEKNDGGLPLNPPTAGDRNSLVTDSNCAANGGTVTYVSGDGNNNSILDANEEWTFNCSVTLTSQAVNNTLANVALGHGLFNLNGVTTDLTYCGDPNNPSSGVRCDQDERDANSIAITVDQGKP